jgi:hypothetical protein
MKTVVLKRNQGAGNGCKSLPVCFSLPAGSQVCYFLAPVPMKIGTQAKESA